MSNSAAEKFTFGYWENGTFYSPQNFYFVDMNPKVAYDMVKALTEKTGKSFKVLNEDVRQAVCSTSKFRLVESVAL